MNKYKDVEEIEEFKKEWDSKQGMGRNDSDVYKETIKKLEDYNRRIAKVPEAKGQFGTILLECSTLKKRLVSIPKDINDQINHNFKGTLTEDMRQLKEELSKITEVLEQMPVSLNIFVDQKNILKYAEQKKTELDTRWTTCQSLYTQCTQNGNKAGVDLDNLKLDLEKLFNELPGYKAKAQHNLAANKSKMEEIIKTSSLALSNKIKSFESKYVEFYLQDKSRIENTGETLDELKRRDTAIHEIRSKVILYKEFLKVLYENDPQENRKVTEDSMSCVKDCENI